MKAFVLRYFMAFVVGASLIASLSCARDQELVSITIVPSDQGFLGPDPTLTAQLRALGTYIHPPVQKDITDQVTWTSHIPSLVNVTSAGVVSPTGIDACGGALVAATVKTNTSSGGRSSSGAIVTGYATITVDNLSVPGCPGFQGTSAQPTLTVNFSGGGTGTVGSQPAGLSCTSACSANFVTNTTVTLTATPTAPSLFGGWAPGSCDSNPTANSCSVLMAGNRTVTVTFTP